MVSSHLFSVQGSYSDGDHFGEESCILGTASAETVVADTFCKCVQLFGPDLTAVMDTFHREQDAGVGHGDAQGVGCSSVCRGPCVSRVVMWPAR